ncbi:MAG TPA: cytochrome c [Anaerolineae bacterium]
MRRLGFWLITLAAILGACFTYNTSAVPNEYASATPPVNLDSPDTIAAGKAIFLTDCVPCHGIAGNGQGATKPAFGPPPVDFTDRARMQPLSPQYLFWRIGEGGRVEPFRSQGSIMPAWKYQLTAEQRWQVIAFIRTLAR